MKLNQVIAVEKSVKNRVSADVAVLSASLTKPALFNGMVKTYLPKDEEGETYPPQKVRVQLNVDDVLEDLGARLSELFDVTATKDFANTNAFADVVVDGEVLIEKAPTTYLLFLEKQLDFVRNVLKALPTLDSADEWKADEGQGLFRTDPFETIRTKKVQRPIVLYDATKEHPAQTQLITEDIAVGTWEQVKFSGATPEPRKAQILDRVEKLRKAVKMAREEANASDVDEKTVGQKIFNWIFTK